MDQLQCLGILQTCEVLKVGMPTRVTYTELKEVRYEKHTCPVFDTSRSTMFFDIFFCVGVISGPLLVIDALLSSYCPIGKAVSAYGDAADFSEVFSVP